VSPATGTGAQAARRARAATRADGRVIRAAHPIAYPALRAVRAPVARIPGLGVLVRDATLLRGVLMDSDRFTKTGPGSPSDLWTPVLGPSVLLNMEGADHAALRRRLSPLFTPSTVDALVAESLAQPLASMTARLRAGERVDVVAEASGNASAMISRLVGLPPGQVDEGLFGRVSAITRVVRLTRPRLTDGQIAQARAVVAELTAHARDAYRAGDESTVPGRMRALDLGEDEAMGAVGAFVLTGTETLVSYLPRLAALLIDSGWFTRLLHEPDALEASIAEGLRVTTPSPVMLRSAVAPATIGPVDVRPGERIILATFAANGAAGPFDPVGQPSASLKQLWFGAGAHFCLGAPLALAQVRVTVRALLDAGDLAIVERAAARGVLIPSYRRLVVERG
jgi:cytochrome P450